MPVISLLWDADVDADRWDSAFDTWDGEQIAIVAVYPVPTPTLELVLRGSHMPVAKLEILDADLSTVLRSLDGQFLDGSVTTNRSSDTFTSASVQLVNDDGTLNPALTDSLIGPGRLARVSRGAMVGPAAVFVAQITGTIDTTQDSAFSGQVSFTIAGRLSLAKRQFTSPLSIAAGTRGADAIRELLELGGLGTSDRLYNLDDGGYIVPAGRSFGTSDEILGVTVKWAFDMGCDLWSDGSGVIRMRPFVTVPVAKWDFAAGQQATLIGVGREISGRQPYNRQVAQGIDADGYAMSAEAKITNPGDPLYWRTDRDLPADPYLVTGPTTTQALQAIAERVLFERSTYAQQITAEAVANPLLAAGDGASFSGAGYPDTFLLDSVSMPLYKGTMRMQSRRVRPIVQ